jgi:hypothetical protein
MKKPGVHIVPTGFEYDRVIKPLIQDFTVQKAYLLIHRPSHGADEYSEHSRPIKRYIDKMMELPIEWHPVYIDIYDFDSTFKCVYKLINDEVMAGNPVYVNLSAAPKIEQVALTLAAFLNNEHGEVELFYVEPEKYYEGVLLSATMDLLVNANEKKAVEKLKEIAREVKEHGMASGESKIHEFPPFPLAKVTDIEYDMLGIIVRNKEISSIKDMKKIMDSSMSYQTPRSNIKYYLDNMARLGLIYTEREMKELRIKPTRIGELYAYTREACPKKEA